MIAAEWQILFPSFQGKDIDIQILDGYTEQMPLLARGLRATAGTPRLLGHGKKNKTDTQACRQWLKVLNKWKLRVSGPHPHSIGVIEEHLFVVSSSSLLKSALVLPWPNSEQRHRQQRRRVKKEDHALAHPRKSISSPPWVTGSQKTSH